jgi:hypothetical protein
MFQSTGRDSACAVHMVRITPFSILFHVKVYTFGIKLSIIVISGGAMGGAKYSPVAMIIVEKIIAPAVGLFGRIARWTS